MNITGVEVIAQFATPIEFPDEWLDAVYTTLEDNMVIASVDMAVNEETGTINFLFGVRPFIDDRDEFMVTVAQESVEAAFARASAADQHATPHLNSRQVPTFA